MRHLLLVLFLASVFVDSAHAQSADGILAGARKNLRITATTELTIAGGVVSVTRSHHKLDTESDDPTDDLDTISGGIAGQLYFFSPADDDRTVIVKHATGNIQCPGGDDISLAEDDDYIVTFFDGTTHIVIAQKLLAGNVGAAP
jgi:hypothetical protein